MVQALSHRGPDADGFYIDEDVSLGHNRLSVIDLSEEANQPMQDNDGELVIVYNGEIYNFLDIKRELESEYDFKTKSDTEVILAGYRKWGKEVTEHLNGMFAFAIWDKRTQEFFCARDHAGIKPFYYFWDGKRFIFASELKAILKHDIPRELNISAFNRYIRVLYSPEPETLVKNIYKLPPSNILILRGHKLSIEPYGQKVGPVSNSSYAEAVSETRKKIMNAVERQLISDVPLGIYLSGGIDSSAVLYSMSQFTRKIKTFSVGFELEDKAEEEKFNHDFNLARRTAKHFGTKHHEFRVSSKEALEVFESMVFHNDEPVSNPTSIPMFLLSRFAKKEVSVVLSGNGGDELFGGYDRYRMALLATYYKKLPYLVRKILNNNKKFSKLDYGSETSLFAQFMFEKDSKLKGVISADVFQNGDLVNEFFESKYFAEESEDVVRSIMSADRKSWLPDQALNLGDKMSMAHGLEERVPFLDNELVIFAESLPTSFKADLFNTKKILKDAFKKDLPEFLFDQPKRGWFSPGAKWLRESAFKAFAQEVLSSDYYEGTRKLFNWSEVERMLNGHLEKKEYNLTILWAILTFQVWAKKYKIVL